MVGRTVPVFRQNENKWNFGVIVSSDPNSLKCQVQFDANDNTEWVDVEATPYTKYLDHWKGQGDTSSSPTQVHDLDEELNFEPLSIDTTLSFEDSKVMSLPSGFSFANIFEVSVAHEQGRALLCVLLLCSHQAEPISTHQTNLDTNVCTYVGTGLPHSIHEIHLGGN